MYQIQEWKLSSFWSSWFLKIDLGVGCATQEPLPMTWRPSIVGRVTDHPIITNISSSFNNIFEDFYGLVTKKTVQVNLTSFIVSAEIITVTPIESLSILNKKGLGHKERPI